MTVYIKGHDFKVELERLCRLFFPDEKIRITADVDDRDDVWAQSVLESNVVTTRYFDGESFMKTLKA
ncbi:MAG: hypothetical protein IJP10_05990 [Clostridia bacterium]|nr:hypothetical protein [Clostridia bacterium]